MKANKFLSKLFENWGAKIFCFVIALFLYLFYQFSQVEKFSMAVPLSVIDNGGVELVSEVPRSVQVVVKAKRGSLNHSYNDKIKASLNLDFLVESGDVEVPVNISIDDDLLELDPLEIKVKPENIKVHVERKFAGAAVVVPSVVGNPLYGYEVTEVSVSPSTVRIVGPESIVKGTKEMPTKTVNLSDLSKSTVIKTGIENTNKYLSCPDEVTYEVQVLIQPVYMERTFQNIPVKYNNLDSRFQVLTPSPSITFSLGGPMPSLEKYITNLNTANIDFSSITESGVYTLPVNLLFPGEFILLGNNEFQFEISIADKEVELSEIPLSEELE